MTPDLDRLLETMLSAFTDDPLYVWLYPDAKRRASQLRPTFALTLTAGLARGHVLWSEHHDAVAVWTAPGMDLLDDHAMDAWLERLREDVDDRFHSAVTAMADCARHRPAEPHWTLHSIAVAAHRQGRGLGTALLRPTLTAIDRAHDTAYLESSNIRNVQAYQRVGFSIAGEVLITGGPTMRPMSRRRAPTSHARPPEH